MRGESSSSAKVYYPELDRERTLEAIRGRVKGLRSALPIKLLVLFGSYAKNRHTAFSDIDLLVVYGGKKREEAYRLAWEALNLRRLELHIYSEDEYEALKASGSYLPREVEEGGIKVWQEGQQDRP